MVQVKLKRALGSKSFAAKSDTIRRMRFTTQWRTAFRVKSFKAVVIRGKLPGEKEGDGGGGRWGRLEIRDRWWRSHVAEMLISWGGGWGEFLFG